MVMEAVGSFRMPVHIALTTWHHVPEDSCCYENLKSHSNFCLWKYYANIIISAEIMLRKFRTETKTTFEIFLT